MLRIILFLALLLAAAFGVSTLADTPGHLLLQWGETEYRVSLLVGVMALLAVTLTVMLIWSVLRLVFRLPSMLGFYNRMRRQARGQEALSRGLIAVGTGDLRAAERYARDSQRLLGQAPLSLLLQAQSAQLAGDGGKAEQSFKAMLDAPETRDLGLRGLFIEAERRGDSESARLFAEQALRREPDSAWAGDAMLAFAAGAQDWRGAIALIDQRVSRRRIDKDEGRKQRAVLLAAAANDVQERNPEESFALAQQALKATPGLVPAAEIVARRLSAKGDYTKASKTIEAAYKENPHPDLAEAYINVRHGDSALDRLKRARYLAKTVPSARESHFIVARAALDAREFTAAREALEALVLQKPTARACLLMAELDEAESGNQGLVRAWLARASIAPRDPAWVSEGVVSENWLPVSPSGKIGGFEWREPPQAIEQHLRARIDVTPFAPAPAENAAVIDVLPAPMPEEVAPPVPAPPPSPEPKIEAASAVMTHAAVEAPVHGAEKPLPFFDAATGEIRPLVPDDPGPDPDAPPPRKSRFSFFG